MNRVEELRNMNDDWIIVVPIDNLTISNDAPIDGVFQIGDVSFMSKNSALRFLQPPNIVSTLSPQNREVVLDNYETLAIITKHDTPSNLIQTAFRDVREAVGILASTDAFYGARHMMSGFDVLGYPRITQRTASFVGATQPNFLRERSRDGGMMQWSVDQRWYNNINNTGLYELFNTINDNNLDAVWRSQIRRASSLLGRSLMSHERTEAFLHNIFALETLLTRRGERNGRKLAQRIKGIAGWHLKNHRPNWNQEINDIFTVRCDAVHDADYSQLNMEHLLIADIYMKNALLNVVLNRSLFTTKDILISTIDNWASTENWPNDGTYNLRWIGNVTFDQTDLNLPMW